jgi:hypothetical protein
VIKSLPQDVLDQLREAAAKVRASSRRDPE